MLNNFIYLDMSIARKLTWMTMGISFTAILAVVVAITMYLIYDMRDSSMRQLEVTAAITGDRNSAALTFLDSDYAQRNLEIFTLSPAIMAACLYDNKGNLFASYAAENPNKMACPPQSSKAANLKEMLTVTRSIETKGEAIGSVYIVSDTSEIDAYVSKIMQITTTAAAMVGLIIIPLIYYFQRTISGPILELAMTAQSITASRDYTLSAKAAYRDETGILARAFNNMLSEVRKRDQELSHANETLEHKVNERTYQLEEAVHRAEAASQAKSEFLSNMSHELRTPLHAITSFAAYGLNEFQTATRAQFQNYFELILKAAERQAKLVNEVLYLAKIEHGEQLLHLKSNDIHMIAKHSVDMVKPLMEEKHITLEWNVKCQQAHAMCDEDKISQVIINLLTNAIKFTPPGKRISLIIEKEGEGWNEQVTIRVKDQGIGIPENEKELIFQSFRQSSRTNTGAGGTGLGLAISRGIIQGHSGRIWAYNNKEACNDKEDGQAEEGACVSFSIPAMQEEGSITAKAIVTEVFHENAA